MAVTSALEAVARELFEALDRKDFGAILALTSDDVQGVDEISRGWLRGRRAMEDYFKSLSEEVSDVHSSLSDVRAVEMGEVGLITAVLDQRYDYQGQPVVITAPTSIVLRREAGAWRIVLLHSVPISDESQ